MERMDANQRQPGWPPIRYRASSRRVDTLKGSFRPEGRRLSCNVIEPLTGLESVSANHTIAGDCYRCSPVNTVFVDWHISLISIPRLCSTRIALEFVAPGHDSVRIGMKSKLRVKSGNCAAWRNGHAIGPLREERFSRVLGRLRDTKRYLCCCWR